MQELPFDQRVATLHYQPGHFVDVGNTDFGRALWRWMRRVDNVTRMETATQFEQPAVEPLGRYLAAEFGAEVSQDRVKQCIGHMARQIMEAIGYPLEKADHRIARNPLFTTAARYGEPEAQVQKGMKITKEQRSAWLERTANSPFNIWLNRQVRNCDGTLDLARLYAVAEAHGVTDRYDALNPGQQRMNIGVKLRAVVPPETYGDTGAT